MLIDLQGIKLQPRRWIGKLITLRTGHYALRVSKTNVPKSQRPVFYRRCSFYTFSTNYLPHFWEVPSYLMLSEVKAMINKRYGKDWDSSTLKRGVLFKVKP